ncbi:MAG: septal ring lytic transglycosylase RlpA family protein [Lamprobacter sp.]|uniref:septal ring lytic transglycosylase RlpA family protein n=1 Tax=Lamprobacter sp. TaxID=3100796 RepID=UPI002B260F5B|nr:septal ring lytic transglycosylase RlpA family protein [Lamprobacter sp.]MEA3639021.1 septal ring lytic transglycosylase RlpA family protein [Lamprobacter sp.]
MSMIALLNGLGPSPALPRLVLVTGLMIALAGCSSAPNTLETSGSAWTDLAPDALPKVEPKSRYGNMRTYVVLGKRYYTKDSSRNHLERGQASWYGKKFHGRKTSSGERYDMHQMTAAHKSLPLPTYALVTNLENGRSAVVKVNDRGPFVGNRIIDLSYAAAKRLDMVNAGTAQVEVRSIDPRDHGKDAKELLRLASAEAGRRGSPTPATPAGGLSRSQQATVSTRSSTTAVSPFLESDRTRVSVGREAASATDGAPIFLQVGAFGSRGNAEQLKRQLARSVKEPILVRAAASGYAPTPLYKVQVGPVRSRRDADALGRRLARLGVEKPLVVVP